MSQYTRFPMTKIRKSSFEDDNDLLDSLQNIPSNFDLALNGPNRKHLSPVPPTAKEDRSLLDPEGLRRLSISTVSSFRPQSRGASPLLNDEDLGPKTWKVAIGEFWQRNHGLFLVALSQMFGALMNVTTRFLELEGNGMHPFQVLFARMSITFVFCCLYMWWKNVPNFPLGAKEVRWLLVARGFTGFFGIFGMYYSLQYLAVADAIVITFLAPSVASYGCYLFLKEPFPRSAQYASFVSLLGVILIARPTSLFSSASGDDFSTSNTTNTNPGSDFPVPTSSQRLSAVAVALLGVFGSAGAYTSIRWIGSRAHPLISVNYFAAWCTLVSTLALSLSSPLHISSDLHFSLPSGVRQWSMLIFLGVCGFVAQYLLTTGLAAGGRGNGSRAVHMVFSQMLFALALDKWVLGQSPGWWSLGGSGLILGSAIFVAIQQQAVRKGTDEEMGGTEEEMGMLRGGDGDVDEDGGRRS